MIKETTKCNALAELAERLDQVGVELCNDFLDADSKDAIHKAQRIVTELAKVKVCKDADKFMPLDKPYDGVTVYAESESDYGGNDFSDKDSDCILDLANAAWNCMTIAEEGYGNGK